MEEQWEQLPCKERLLQFACCLCVLQTGGQVEFVVLVFSLRGRLKKLPWNLLSCACAGQQASSISH